MRITQEADYALRIVCILANDNKVLDAGRIADASGVTQRFALKILRKLAVDGLVRSYKGASGGYELARGADEITVKNVIEIIDGPIEISKCMDSEHFCTRQGLDKSGCVMHHIFSEISTLLAQKLDAVRISDVVGAGVEDVPQILTLINNGE
jgi:Rrf2 family protein